MKSFKKTFRLMMVLVLIVALFSGSAVAAKKPSKSSKNDTEYQTMTPGTWYEVKLSQKFMIKLTKDSIVSIKVNNYDDEYPLGIDIYSDKGMKNRAGELGTRNASKQLAFQKGTYYTSIIGDGWGSSDVQQSIGKVMIKTSSFVDKRNYCPSRAVSLKKKKNTPALLLR